MLGAALSLGTFILTDQFIPWARANIEAVITLAMEDIFLESLHANSSYNDSAHGISIIVTCVDARGMPSGGEIAEPIRPTLINPIIRYRLERRVATITAREATLKFDLQEQQVLLTLLDSRIETPRRQHMPTSSARTNSFSHCRRRPTRSKLPQHDDREHSPRAGRRWSQSATRFCTGK